MTETKSVLKVENLTKWFEVKKSSGLFAKKGKLKAVDGVSFQVFNKETFGLAGESGCGKTTIGKLILRLYEATDGHVYFKGRDIFSIRNRKEMKTIRRKLQMIFQEPYEYLSPWKNIHDALAEPLRIHKLIDGKEDELDQIIKIMDKVNLSPPHSLLTKMPYELSGGQRQRVIIARALLLEPEFLVADEPVSMLDVSIRSGILNLLGDLKEEFGLTSIFITHDLATAKYMCNRIAIMYLGKLMELGPTNSVIDIPQHPYTKALITAVPIPDPTYQPREIQIKGRLSAPIDPPPGCRFTPRCPIAKASCKVVEPELVEVKKGHFVACPYSN